MSIKHMTSVWESTTLTTTEKLVALAIADCANDSGIAWPGYKNLMQKTGIKSKQTLSKTIQGLRQKGWCTWTNKHTFAGGKSSNIYQILPQSTETVPCVDNQPETHHSTETVPCATESTETVPLKVQKLDTDGTETVHETLVETSVKKRQSFAQTSFSEFWEKYPKKKSKGTAKKAWAKINPGKKLFQSIIRGLEQAIRSKDWEKENGKYIPYPATWLNAEGWEDEDEPTATSIDYTRQAEIKRAHRKRIEDLKKKKARQLQGATC